MIRPLLVERGGKAATVAVAAFGIAAVGSAALVGAVVSLAGSFSIGTVSVPVELGLLGVSGGLLALADTQVMGLRTFSFKRQTNPRWWASYGPTRASFLWGLDLGAGFTTIRVASLYWLVWIGLFVIASPAFGSIALAFYGLGLTTGLVFGVAWFDRPNNGARANVAAILWAPAIRRLVVAYLTATSAAWLIAAPIVGLAG